MEKRSIPDALSMGKNEQNLQQQQTSHTLDQRSSRFFCARCSVVLSLISKELSLKCVVLLFFSLAVFLSGFFWLLPRSKFQSGFDAKAEIKLSGKQAIASNLVLL